MNAAARMISRVAIAAVLVVPAVTIAADAQDTVQELNLGRVFMTKTERQLLDRLRANRNSGVVERTSAPSVDPIPARAGAQATGFIRQSNGRTYRWANGDFQAVSHAKIRLSPVPGRIEVSRDSAGSMSRSGDGPAANKDHAESEDGSQAPATDDVEER